MLADIPYNQAAKLPLDFGAALLSDERLDNTHQIKSNAPSSKSNAHLNKSNGTTYIAKGRKHSNSKD
ncbi:hypothetical protein ACT43S_08220 [Acinetobacter baumannii]